MTPTPIHTLQFPDIHLPERQAFLAFINEHVVYFALSRKDRFIAAGANAEYFHKDAQRTKASVPVRIHALMINGLFSLRAYTRPAIDTLLFWQELYLKKYPEHAVHLLSTRENFVFETLENPMEYESTNWIPYRDCHFKNGQFIKDASGTPASFQSTLTGNLRTFLSALAIDNTKIRTLIRLNTPPKDHKTNIALCKNSGSTPLAIKKIAFRVRVTVNVRLPLYFSLGQNVGYGNGIFSRIIQ